MSQANVEIAQRAFAAAVRKPTPDFETMTALFDADHEYVSILSEIEGRSWQGASGYRDFLQTFGESLDFETALESATELDESRVLLEATVWSRGKSSEALVTERRWIVMTFRDKTVTRTQSYPSRQAALEAVGLEESAMSQKNVEIVLADFENVNRRDWAAVMATYDEDIVLFVSSSSGPDAGVFRGREAVGRWFGDWFRAFGKDYRFEVEEVRSLGDRVLAVVSHHGSGRASGANVEQVTANLYTVRGAKIVRVELYPSSTEALKAVGLAE